MGVAFDPPTQNTTLLRTLHIAMTRGCVALYTSAFLKGGDKRSFGGSNQLRLYPGGNEVLNIHCSTTFYYLGSS